MGHATVVVQTNDTYGRRHRRRRADRGRAGGVRPDRGAVGVAARYISGRSAHAGRDRRRRGGPGRPRRPRGGQHGLPAGGAALPPGVVQRGRRRPQGRGPEPDRRRGHGRGADRPAGRAGRPARPAGHLGPRPDRGSRGRVRPGRRDRGRRGHRQRRIRPARHHRPGRPGRPGPGPALRRRPRRPGRRDGPARPRRRRPGPAGSRPHGIPAASAATPPHGRLPSSPPTAGRNRPTTRVRRRPTWAPRP